MPGPRLSLAYPRLWRPTTVPTFPVEVDWTHPQAQGLQAAYIPGLTFTDITGINGTLTAVGSPPFAQTAMGQGVQFNTNTGSLTVAAGTATTGLQGVLHASSGATLFWSGVILGGSTNGGNVPLIGISPISNNPPYAFLNLDNPQAGSPSGITLAWNGNNNFTSIGPFGTAVTSVPGTRAASFSYAGNAIAYLGGINQGSSAFGGAPAGFSDGSLFFGTVPAFAGTSNNITTAGLVFAEALGPDRIAWLNAEPFAMLRPIVRRSFFVGGTTGAYTGSISDSATTSDSFTGVMAATGSITDSAASSDSFAAGSFTASRADSATTSDSFSGVLAAAGSFSGSAVTSDSVTCTAAFTASLTDSVASSDQFVAGAFAATIGDTVASSDVFTSVGAFVAAIADSAITSDSVTDGVYLASLADTVATSTSFTGVMAASGSVSDSAASSDAFVKPSPSSGSGNFFFGG